ncbi:MAG: hypothetical protein IJA10_08160 [Lachnospiraceae bacterium]|nr:hypothetical protein [Lachnospiraceae bacterium]
MTTNEKVLMLKEEQKGKLETASNLFTMENTVSENMLDLSKSEQCCKNSYSFLAL